MNHSSIHDTSRDSQSGASGTLLWAVAALALGLMSCGPVSDLDMQGSALSAGHMTGVCGVNPLPPGYQGSSGSGCDGRCSSSWTDGTCSSPDTTNGILYLFGCPGKTGGGQCDLSTGGTLLGEGPGTASFSGLADQHPELCTFQIDVWDRDANPQLRDFLIWERDECAPPPNPNEPPVALCADAEVCAPFGQCVANVSINVGSYDPDEDPITTSQTPPGPYGLGRTEVTLDVSDDQVTSSCQAGVTVNDCQPPQITCPHVVAECTGDRSAEVDMPPAEAIDLCTEVTVNDPASARYPLGTTEVPYEAVDAYGNAAQCIGTATVQDTQGPITDEADPIVLGPPNHKYHRISLADCIERMEDVCEGPLPLEYATITCVTSDEPDDSTGDGHTVNDIIIVDPQHVDLRAERSGNGDGRVYRIYFDVRDSAGNVTADSCTVEVLHGQQPAVENPPDHDVPEGCLAGLPTP